MKYLEIMNFNNRRFKTPVDISDLSNIDFIKIAVFTGDEIVTVRFKDGKEIEFDSADLAKKNRIIGYYDGSYVLYDSKDGTNCFDEFEKRKPSYDMSKFMWEEE